MLQLRGDLRLTRESLGGYAQADLRPQQLDHDAATEADLLGEEHARHASATELALDDELGTKGGLQLATELGAHGDPLDGGASSLGRRRLRHQSATVARHTDSQIERTSRPWPCYAQA